MLRNLLIAAPLAVLLGACGTDSLLGQSDFITKAAETAGKVEEQTVGNFAKGADFYCENVPKAARNLLVKRINSYTTKYDVVDMCGPAKEPAS